MMDMDWDDEFDEFGSRGETREHLEFRQDVHTASTLPGLLT
jgi:hypothetical protein